MISSPPCYTGFGLFCLSLAIPCSNASRVKKQIGRKGLIRNKKHPAVEMATGSQLSQRAWIGKRALLSSKKKPEQKTPKKATYMDRYCKISTYQLRGVLEQRGVESHQFNSGCASPGVGWYLTSECYDLKNPLCGAAAQSRRETAAPRGSAAAQARSCSLAALPSLQSKQACTEVFSLHCLVSLWSS